MTDTLQSPEYKRLRAIYLIMMTGAVACFVSHGIVFVIGLVALTMAIIMAYVYRKRGNDEVHKSHYDWQIRIFWIGNLIVFPLAMIVNFIAIYYTTDLGAMLSGALSGSYGLDAARLQQDVMNFEQENMWTLVIMKWATYGVAMFWWLHRYAYGYRLLQNHEVVTAKN